MDISKYLLLEGNFDLQQINFRLEKTPITLSLNDIPSTISPFISFIIKPTSSIGNLITSNLLESPLNSNISNNQEYGQELANLAKMYTDKAKYSSKNNSFAF